jgi:hypothetical protein
MSANEIFVDMLWVDKNAAPFKLSNYVDYVVFFNILKVGGLVVDIEPQDLHLKNRKSELQDFEIISEWTSKKFQNGARAT